MVKTQITFDIFNLLIIVLGAILLYLFVSRVLGIGGKQEYFQIGGAEDGLEAAGGEGTTDGSDRASGEGSCACQIQQAVKKGLCYANRRIRSYAEENALLKHYVDRLLKQADEPFNYNLAYRKRLSNKYYPVKPAQAYTENSTLNLREDDFSTKTFSESKFLAPTKKSKYHGQDVHYGSYLCDDMYPYNDPKITGNYQMELTPQVRLY